ncbi:MAG: DUF4139 domain-containing protein [Verrucomicrobia bacterium]|nr:DUF4139 domain-containing protein [Verrucomicrobiota bacterium]
MKRILIAIVLLGLVASPAVAKVDLVTLPNRDTVQLTIYNSADLTLVRESRALTLKHGANRLQFSWANTLIDPTSLEMLPKANADKIDIQDLTYPPRVTNLGVWNISSEMSGKVPVEITYLTSGLTWRAFYMGTLTNDEKTMRLQGYVVVTNTSGEDYENAQVRLVVGKVHILDQIAFLARLPYPFGRPNQPYGIEGSIKVKRDCMLAKEVMTECDASYALDEVGKKEIIKEGLSEYFLYTIEGSDTIASGWSKRLPSFDVAAVPVVNLYKYEEERYHQQVVRFLSFANDVKHNLGETPTPGGNITVYRTVDPDGHLSYTGRSAFKYIPVGEEVELNLGPVENVLVEPTLMDFSTANYLFHPNGTIRGWDEIRRHKVDVKNTREIPVKIEVKRNFDTTYWDIETGGDFGAFEAVDKDTVKFTLELAPRTNKEFTYVLTTYHGNRIAAWKPRTADSTGPN